MQRACLALAFALCLPALAACDGGGGCLIDSDCADFAQVCIAQRCTDPGNVPDAGGRDAGPEPDAGGEPDAGSDAGTPPTDGGGDASMGDGGTPPCADVTGVWTVGTILAPPCGAAAAGYATTITAGAAACEFIATSNDLTTPAPALDGTFTLAMDNSLAGMLSAGGDPAVACTGSVSGTTLTVVCGSCVMQLTR